jgi:V/A-type H+-transporting ATPase subunit A
VYKRQRLEIINKAVQNLIDSHIDFEAGDMDDEQLKELIKQKFDELRQWWRDWNYSAKTEEQLAQLPNAVSKFILQEEYAV